jgi:SOS-response transcriptional repressor LexA
LNQYDLSAGDFESMPQLKGRGLSERQAALLDFIRDPLAATGNSPGTTVIAKRLGLKTPSEAYKMLCGLELKGYLASKPGVKWSVRLTAKALEERPPR